MLYPITTLERKRQKRPRRSGAFRNGENGNLPVFLEPLLDLSRVVEHVAH